MSAESSMESKGPAKARIGRRGESNGAQERLSGAAAEQQAKPDAGKDRRDEEG